MLKRTRFRAVLGILTIVTLAAWGLWQRHLRLKAEEQLADARMLAAVKPVIEVLTTIPPEALFWNLDYVQDSARLREQVLRMDVPKQRIIPYQAGSMWHELPDIDMSLSDVRGRLSFDNHRAMQSQAKGILSSLAYAIESVDSQEERPTSLRPIGEYLLRHREWVDRELVPFVRHLVSYGFADYHSDAVDLEACRLLLALGDHASLPDIKRVLTNHLSSSHLYEAGTLNERYRLGLQAVPRETEATPKERASAALPPGAFARLPMPAPPDPPDSAHEPVHFMVVTGLAWMDNDHLMTWDTNKAAIAIWHTGKGTLADTYQPDKGHIQRGEVPIIVTGKGQQLVRWSLSDGFQFEEIGVPPQKQAILAPNLVLVDNRLHDRRTGESLGIVFGAAKHLQLMQDGNLLVTWGDDELRGFDTATGDLKFRLYYWRNAPTISPDGHWLVGYLSGKIGIWDLEAKEALGMYAADHFQRWLDFPPWPKPGAFVISPDSRVVAIATLNAVRFFELETGELLRAYQPVGDRPQALAYSPDGTRVAVALANGTALIYPAPVKADSPAAD